jgi:hypothetical protein
MPIFDEDTCVHELSPVADWFVHSKSTHVARDWRLGNSKVHKPARAIKWNPLRRDNCHITATIESSRRLLSLVDEDEKPVCSQETWNRAVKFLGACARRAWEANGVKIDSPEVLVGPDQSIDLHWKADDFEMLINIPADPSMLPSYYGDAKDGTVIRGTVASGENRGLLSWLTARK